MKNAFMLLTLAAPQYWLGCDHQDHRVDDPFGSLRGRWEAVSGDLHLEDAVGKPYAYNWYVIEARQGTQPTITWDNGRTCITSEATALDERLGFTVGEVLVTVEPRKAGEAMIHFRDQAVGTVFSILSWVSVHSYDNRRSWKARRTQVLLDIYD